MIQCSLSKIEEQKKVVRNEYQVKFLSFESRIFIKIRNYIASVKSSFIDSLKSVLIVPSVEDNLCRLAAVGVSTQFAITFCIFLIFVKFIKKWKKVRNFNGK